MPGPLLPLVIAGGVAGLVAYLARRRRSREVPVLAELAIRIEGARLIGDELTVAHRGLPVTVSFGVPQALPSYERGLFARAPYAMGGGPSFVASPTDVSAHARRMGAGYPLGARFTRYEVVGHHQEARALVAPVAARVDSSLLPAPLFVASDCEITVYLPEFVPDDDKLEVTQQLVELTGELACFGYEQLERLRAALGGSIAVEPRRRPSIFLRTHRDEVAIDVMVTWHDPGGGAFEFGLVLAAERGPRSVEVEDATASLPTADERRRATQLAKRSLRSDGSRVALAFDRMLAAADLEMMLGVLVRLAGQIGRDSPFR